MSDSGRWIGVDLDGTLAEYHGGGLLDIGPPIPAMVDRVRRWLSDGRDVRIFTARISPIGTPSQMAPILETQHQLIWAWCSEHLGRPLPVTYCKDGLMIEYWDDAAVQVERNTGRPVDPARAGEAIG